MRVESPAKLNLGLRVLGKRRDGFHEIHTLFHRISLRDFLRLRKRREGIRIACSHPRVPKRKNLIALAFRLLKTRRPFSGGVHVSLVKKIPVGGGLGGGSSNAAAFLLGMNRMFRLGLVREALMELGEKLGSDVPFFLSGFPSAIGKGRGERLQRIGLRRRLWFLLFLSPGGLSTRKVYQGVRTAPAVSLTRVERDAKIGFAFLEKGNTEQAARLFQNDLAASAERIRKSLRKTREKLSELQLGICQMSGSGPTQYIAYPTRTQALRALRVLRRAGISKKIVLCHSL